MAWKGYERRKTPWVKRDIQGKIARWVAMATLFSLVVTFFAALLTLIVTRKDASVHVRDFLVIFASSTGISAVFVGGYNYWATMVLSNRIAGPIYRLEQQLKTMATGDLRKDLTLRDTDELKEVAEQVNQFTGQMRDFVQRDREMVGWAVGELQALHDRLKKYLAIPKQELEVLTGVLERVRVVTSAFKLDDEQPQAKDKAP